MKRFTRVLTLTGITAAMAFGTVGAAQASHGADDPAGTHHEHVGKADHNGHNGAGDHRRHRHHHGHEHGVNHP